MKFRFLISSCLICTFSVFIALFFNNCSKNADVTQIELISPKSKSPLLYNGDTMFIKVSFYNENTISEISTIIKNHKDSAVYYRNYQINSNQYLLSDTFVFNVNDHSNFIMTLKAVSAHKNESKLDVYIHVMP